MSLHSSHGRAVARFVIASLALTLALVRGTTATAQARPSSARAPVAPLASGTLELVGMKGEHKTLTAADVYALPHVEATVSSHNVQGTYRGVPLGELLKLIGRPVGEALRGKALATVVSVEAVDGYRVTFVLAEVDSGFTSKVIFLADQKNGAAIDGAEGPFRVIVPDEKRPARWAKQVVRIRLVSVE